MKFNLVKREDASELVLIIMSWAVISLLSARIYLEIMGYPQVGRGNWHIAHVLWGGLFMLAGMLINVVIYGEKTRRIGAAVFGYGLGWFIDEMGKFLSRDNNYFFQPAIMFIYMFYILLFLIYRYLERINPKDPKTLLYQSIEKLEDVVENDFDKTEKINSLAKLKKVISQTRGVTKTLAMDLYKLVSKTATIEVKDSVNKRFWLWLKNFSYNRIFRRRFTFYLLSFMALVFVAGGIIDLIYIGVGFRQNNIFNLWGWETAVLNQSDIRVFLLKSIADVLTSILYMVGIYAVLLGKKIRGIGYFQYGLLVNILIGSVFKFYFEQLSAIFGLIINLVVYYWLSLYKKEKQIV